MRSYDIRGHNHEITIVKTIVKIFSYDKMCHKYEIKS